MESGEYKFNNCKWRSDVERISLEPYCCGTYTKWGFVCEKLNIAQIKPIYCQGCQVYEPRETETN